TYVEEVVQKADERSTWKSVGVGQQQKLKMSKPLLLDEIAIRDEHRIKIPDKELHRVLGGGLVPGSLVLMGGEPGIGKSTLLLQLALLLKNQRVLYVSGEESEQQIKLRANRVGEKNEQLLILTETSLENIFAQINETQPSLV